MPDRPAERPVEKSQVTYYRNIRFRSRTEGKWTFLFDLLDVQYQYEPKLFKMDNGIWYLPDFYLSKQDVWIEIKGEIPSDLAITKSEALSLEVNKPVYIIIGYPHVQTFQSKAKDDQSYVKELCGYRILAAKDGKMYSFKGTSSNCLLKVLGWIPNNNTEYRLYTQQLAEAGSHEFINIFTTKYFAYEAIGTILSKGIIRKYNTINDN